MKIKWLAGLVGLVLLQACGSGTSSEQTPPVRAAKFVNWSTVQKISAGDSAFAAQATGGVVAYTDNYNGLNLVDVASLEQVRVYRKLVDPEVPDGVGHSGYDMMYNVSVAGNVASVAVTPACLGLCSGNSNEIRLYDISDRSKAVYLATVASALSPEAILAEERTVYVTGTNHLTSRNQLVMIDITDPRHPRESGAVDIIGAGNLAKAGNRVFVSQVDLEGAGPGNYKNIQAIDVSDPSAPILLGPPATIISGNIRYSPIVVSGEFAYVGDSVNGLYVLKIGDILSSAPSEPVTKIAQPGAIHAMASYGNHLYLACGTAGLRIYDIQKPEAPVLVKTISTSTSIRFVSVTSGRGVYITDGASDSLSGEELHIFYLDN